MAGKQAADLRKMSGDDLHKRANELAQELFELRRRQATGQVDNPAKLQSLRKSRARVLTLIREVELEEASRQG